MPLAVDASAVTVMLRIYDGNGAPPAVRIAGVMQLREGKLIARRDYYDPASYRAQAGLGGTVTVKSRLRHYREFAFG